MLSLGFVIQIFLSIVLALVIVIQKSSNDGVLSKSENVLLQGAPQNSFITKLTIILSICFIMNSLFLARDAIKTYRKDKDLISQLENKNVSEGNEKVKQME